MDGFWTSVSGAISSASENMNTSRYYLLLLFLNTYQITYHNVRHAVGVTEMYRGRNKSADRFGLPSCVSWIVPALG